MIFTNLYLSKTVVDFENLLVVCGIGAGSQHPHSEVLFLMDFDYADWELPKVHY